MYQGNTLMSAGSLKQAGISGIIHKATEGVTFKDKQYHARRELAKEAGLLWGAYHFGRSGQPYAQAALFLSWADADKDTLIALDLEQDMLLEEAEIFVQTIHDILGRWPVVYTSAGYMNRIGRESAVLARCPLWIASYRGGDPTMPSGTWLAWDMWQYTDGIDGPMPHTVAGATGDLNRFNGTLEELRVWWAK
jgi:lysozyme